MSAQKWHNGLRFQIVVLLTIALLPLGAVAIYQTNRVEDQAEQSAELALLALTARAARTEELMLERASGVTRFFATVAPDFIVHPNRCAEELTSFVAEYPVYSFIGIFPISGISDCSSAAAPVDLSGWDDFQTTLQTQERAIIVGNQPLLGDTPVFVVSEPYYTKGVFSGFVSLAIPRERLPEPTDSIESLGLVDLLTFNAQGDILTARSGLEAARAELPKDRALQLLNTTKGVAFSGPNTREEQRTYTVTPIQGTPVTVMGIWRTDETVADKLDAFIKPAVFPILMWFASMAVAMLSIYTLVLRPITRMRRNMDAFSKDRSIDKEKSQGAMPYELQALTDNFDSLTDAIMREEARLEDTLREKNVLIKEVHHRVKNNLQLIASIMNMHIRTAKHRETKSVLSRVQERVLSLATIHRDLYQSHDGGRVNAGNLVKEIVAKSVEMGISGEIEADVQTDIDPVMLYPDQAVPLSLLVAEALTNVMKYLGTNGSLKPQVITTLKQDGTRCTLTVINSIGAHEDQESTGLGAQLINAFAIQLGGTPKVEQTDTHYTFTLEFHVEEFEPEVRDF